MKWNKWGFTPHLCSYRLNWARRTSWGWWYEWGDTALQTHDSKLSPVGLRHVNSRSWRLPTIFNLYDWAERKHFVIWNLNARAWDKPAISDFPSRHQGFRPLVLLLHIRTHYLITDIKMMCYVFLLVCYKLISKTVPIICFPHDG